MGSFVNFFLMRVFMDFCRVFHGCFQNFSNRISWAFQVCFIGVSMVFHRYFKDVLRVWKSLFKCVSKVFLVTSFP